MEYYRLEVCNKVSRPAIGEIGVVAGPREGQESMGHRHRHRLFANAVAIVALTAQGSAYGSSCFAMAESYYEQIYCEIRALGRGAELPPFTDFRNNDAVTQALLLKRPAARLGIVVMEPAAPASPGYGKAATRDAVPDGAHEIAQSIPVSAPLASCARDGRSIRCPDAHYQLVGNRANRHLAADALHPDQRLRLNRYAGAVNGDGLVRYLQESYGRYLEKMLAIGLGAVTLSYRKFEYIYHDVTARGADFGARFETMYRFLKRDKQNMDVAGATPDPGATPLAACELFAGRIIACDGGNRNFLFVKTDDPRQPVAGGQHGPGAGSTSGDGGSGTSQSTPAPPTHSLPPAGRAIKLE